ncbi:MAG: hypothetical protein COS94_03415 [Candidatus Hydrogenedentes bacterium CG07_land_8_20_14_0_80_42_17]|nr:MAG: hypothetical protein COS94_03415 [Candidatus Hydrogenedentes bacterium CG07_land_8_20_14_0_80_42_17]
MRFLADENFDTLVVKTLREAGHDVSWIRDIAPGAPDEEVWDHAVKENRILLTFDKDFGEVAFVRTRTVIPGIILFRLHGVPADEIVAKITAAITSREEWLGHFSVVDDKRIRMTPLRRPRVQKD